MKFELSFKKKKLISFVKMHGDGNDFVIIDNRKGEYDKLTGEDYVRIADRRIGIGCDQVVTMNKSKMADCKMIIHNTDGSKAEMCGNAARCVADLIISEKPATKSTADIEIITGAIVHGSRLTGSTNVITINMGKPKTEWQDIPLSRSCDTLSVPIRGEGLLSNPVAVNMGNPHIVFFVNDLTAVPLEQLAPTIEKSDLFQNGVNISVAEIEKNDSSITIKAKIWERGVGLTQSCGSASCAIFVACMRKGYVREDQKATIKFPGGNLLLGTDKSGDIFVTGNVCYVFSGTMYK